MPTALIIFGIIVIIGIPILYLLYKKSQQNKYNYGFMGKKLAAVVAVALLSTFSIMSVVVLNKQEIDSRTNASKVWSSDINYTVNNGSLNVTAIIFQNSKVINSNYNLKVKVYNFDNLIAEQDLEITSINYATFYNYNSATKLVIELYDGNNLVKSFEKLIQ